MITGTLSMLKTAGDTVKSLIQLRDVALVREKAIELQTQILAAQEAAIEARASEQLLVSQVSELKKRIADLESWDAEKQAYELRDLGRGAFAYARKANAQPPEPPHWLCTNCFGNHRKSILQFSGEQGRDARYSCPACNGKVLAITTLDKTQSTASRATEVQCPHCSSGLHFISERDHPTFGEFGVKLHVLKCTGCSGTFERQFTPGKRYEVQSTNT